MLPQKLVQSIGNFGNAHCLHSPYHPYQIQWIFPLRPKEFSQKHPNRCYAALYCLNRIYNTRIYLVFRHSEKQVAVRPVLDYYRSEQHLPSNSTAETLRKWVRQAERDKGLCEGLTPSDRERLKALELENRELKRALNVGRVEATRTTMP